MVLLEAMAAQVAPEALTAVVAGMVAATAIEMV